MEDGDNFQRIERTTPSRVGVSALNLISPGLGLLRIGNWRAALFFSLAPFVFYALVTFGMGHFPITGYGSALVALAIVVGLLAVLYLVPIALTWRESRFVSPGRWWTKWYCLVFTAIFLLALSQFAAPLMHNFYKPFYAPSASMAPTIAKGDKYIADMRWRGPIRRGQIVLFQGPYGVRVSRIVAIPGDRIAIRGGVPVLNGQNAVQLSDGRAAFEGEDGSRMAAMLKERLPGEISDHGVFDTGLSEFDEMQEVAVPANHFFMLGDNRDNSADSRVPSDLGGVGMVASTAIIGRPMYIHWSRDHQRIGFRLDN